MTTQAERFRDSAAGRAGARSFLVPLGEADVHIPLYFPDAVELKFGVNYQSPFRADPAHMLVMAASLQAWSNVFFEPGGLASRIEKILDETEPEKK